MPRKNLLATLAIALASTALGIAAYHLYATEQLKKRDQLWQQRLDSLAANIDTRAEQAIARITGERAQSEQAAVAEALRVERVANGIVAAAGLRTDLAIYLAEHGKLPQSLEDLHYPPDWVPYQHLAEVRLRRNGAIELQFREDSGLAGKVRLTPNVQSSTSMIIGWECTSSDFAFIAQAAAECRYTR
ncbi:MAG: pilin [Cardiobacteriaceae bacterium]|nr:pilin [Cardiobacteriaceae bacterium]